MYSGIVFPSLAKPKSLSFANKDISCAAISVTFWGKTSAKSQLDLCWHLSGAKPTTKSTFNLRFESWLQHSTPLREKLLQLEINIQTFNLSNFESWLKHSTFQTPLGESWLQLTRLSTCEINMLADEPWWCPMQPTVQWEKRNEWQIPRLQLLAAAAKPAVTFFSQVHLNKLAPTV